MAKKFNENYKFNGYSRVTDTEKGKTKIGQELELFGVVKMSDMSEETFKKFIKSGYDWMMPLFFDENGKKCKPWEAKTTRAGFFYKSFATKKERDASSKKARTALVKPEKPEKKSTKKSTKKAEPKTTKAKPTMEQLMKMSKKELAQYIEANC